MTGVENAMKSALPLLSALVLASCGPAPAPTQNPTALQPGQALSDNRAAAFVAMGEILPGLDPTPSAFHNDTFGDCGVAASAELSVRLCGRGAGVQSVLVTDRKPGVDVAPSIAAVTKVLAPDATPEALARVTGEARRAVAAGEAATVCPTTVCLRVIGFDRTWIVSAESPSAPH